MKIAIIGAGNVGSALGGQWVKKGHEVVFGVKDSNSPKTVKALKEIPKARATSVKEAAAGAEVVVLATPFPATQDAVRESGDLSGKIVIDCTNPLKPDYSDLSIGFDTSAGEQVQQWAKAASVFKAFNQNGSDNMASQEGYAMKLVMFVCGDDEGKKPIAMKLVEDVGFEAIDAGKMKSARLLEPLAMLWIRLAIDKKFGRDFGFSVARRRR